MTNQEFKAAILPQINQALLDIENRAPIDTIHVVFTVPAGTYKVEATTKHLEAFKTKVNKLPCSVKDPSYMTHKQLANRRLSPQQQSAARRNVEYCIE